MGERMQNVKFASLNEFLDYLPEEELRITEALRSIVLDTIPYVKEKLSYNVPFYSLKRSICFIWPGSVLWGKTKNYEGVRLGFIKGHLMEDPDGFLVAGKRRFILCHDFHNVQEIDPDTVRSFLFQAMVLDETHQPKKKK